LTNRLQGPEDPVFGKDVAAEHIKLFNASPDAKLTLLDGAGHYLNATSPKETEEAVLEMVKRYA
jgi:pimeloyl-ACP methyl ester carboxylesterase